MTIVLAILALLATCAAAYCAYADGALLAVDDEQPAADPLVAALVGRREAAHRALAFARILSQLLAGAAAVGALKASDVPAVQVAPLVVVVGILAIVLAESGARAAGDAEADRGVHRVQRGIHAIENLMAPVVGLGRAADAALERAIPPSEAGLEEREAAVEQFREVVAAEANVSADDQRLLHGVFSLGDTEVQDIMVPRVDVIALNQASTWAEVVEAIRVAGQARYPVYERSIDNIVGVLHAKDLLPSVLAGAEPLNGWRALIRSAQYIPGTKAVDAQLREFKSARRHMAIVVDEFGGTSGIVTLEDILEVIVGDIRDEHDIEEPDVRREPAGDLSVSARVTLGDLSELTGEDFTRDDVSTVGGLVYAEVGGVPHAGDAVTVGHHRLVVERIARRRIERVRVTRTSAGA